MPTIASLLPVIQSRFQIPARETGLGVSMDLVFRNVLVAASSRVGNGGHEQMSGEGRVCRKYSMVTRLTSGGDRGGYSKGRVRATRDSKTWGLRGNSGSSTSGESSFFSSGQESSLSRSLSVRTGVGWKSSVNDPHLSFRRCVREHFAVARWGA